ncbi:high frequency lysogenization protein HflD [Neptunicella sp. SCSIO 80796]|uniref:high frequency lysogenization protein HflD n=1 Tax=Neptunicella plasticusilytica TaxID=3117012 RepID=UPI003A4D1E7E
MKDSIQDKHIALAGVCQAASLVQQIARKQQLDEHGFLASIHSLVVIDADNTEQVFGDISKLQLGFTTLAAQLSNKAVKKDAEITRYIAGILQLERKLAGNSQKMSELGQRISQLQRQQSLYSLFDSQMLSNIASVYTEVVSPIGAKIQVAGDPEQLKQPLNQHKVRALLLAGIRAAVLWRQLGGKRRQILFSRRHILNAANDALQHINQIH